MSGVGLDEGTALRMRSKTFPALAVAWTLQLILSFLQVTIPMTSVTTGEFYLVLNFTEMGSHSLLLFGEEPLFEPYHGYVIDRWEGHVIRIRPQLFNDYSPH